MKSLFTLLLLALLLPADAQKRKVKKLLQAAEEKHQYHAGLFVSDPASGKILIDYKGDRYFTPASNTKIFTLYTSLKILGDSIPGLYYENRTDSLIIWGTGDPSLLYENVPESQVLKFLNGQTADIYLSDHHFHDEPFGSGWSWGDYKYGYQVEKAPLPLFGNYFLASKREGEQHLRLSSQVFRRYILERESSSERALVRRQMESNITEYYPGSPGDEFSRAVPFRYSTDLAAEILSDTLGVRVKAAGIPLSTNRSTVYSVKADSLYKVLMQSSDNFIAEQLLLLCALQLSDTLNSNIAIDYAKENFFERLPDEPLWVDGSGLSRYNQFTPRTIAKLWQLLLEEHGRDRLFPLLAVGGQYGTIRNWYKADPPFIYGKTGTLRNHHSLSGYLLTDKGRILVFSFMNGHFPGSSSTVKEEMERILQLIKNKY